MLISSPGESVEEKDEDESGRAGKPGSVVCQVGMLMFMSGLARGLPLALC